MTALPLVWGEGDVSDVLAGRSAPAPAYERLEKRYRVQPLDVLSEASLAPHRLIMLAQPRALAPAELVALDAWVRGGGRALILTDPLLAWHSDLPFGDPRRPPAIGLLDPLLTHWGLTLDWPADGAPLVTEQTLHSGQRLRTAGRGMLVSTKPACTVGERGLIARCRLGTSQAVVVADADLLDAGLWRGMDNMDVVEAWLHSLAR